MRTVLHTIIFTGSEQYSDLIDFGIDALLHTGYQRVEATESRAAAGADARALGWLLDVILVERSNDCISTATKGRRVILGVVVKYVQRPVGEVGAVCDLMAEVSCLAETVKYAAGHVDNTGNGRIIVRTIRGVRAGAGERIWTP